MSDERLIEVPNWDDDPEKLVKEKLTPKALGKLWVQLDSPNPNAVDRAIDKVIAIDKRFKKDAMVPQGNTLNVFGNFDPAYLKQVGQGLKAIFGGESGDDPINVTPVPEKRPPKG